MVSLSMGAKRNEMVDGRGTAVNWLGELARGMGSNQKSEIRNEGARRRKKVLDIFPYGNVLFAHGTSGDNFGCFQPGGGAAAAGNPELSCTARTARRGDCGLSGAGAAVGFETPTRFA